MQGRRRGVRCLRERGGVVTRWCWLSGRERDRPQAGERFGQGERPGPVLGQAQEDLPLAAGDPGSHVQEPVAEGFGFGPVQVRLVGQEHRLRQGEQVRGDEGELDPDLVHVRVPGREMADAGWSQVSACWYEN